MAKKKLRQRNTRRNVAPFYKGAIFILVALYVVMFVYGKVKPDPEDKMATKTYKVLPIGNYNAYLVDKKYNPKTEELIAKIYIQKKSEEVKYVPLTKDYFSFDTTLKTGDGENVKTNFQMPTKNFVVVDLKNVPEKSEMAKLEMMMKENIVDVGSDKQTKSSVTFYLDLNEKNFDENLKLADSKTYIQEGYEQEIKFINKDIVSETKNRNRFVKEKENAEAQLELIENDLKDLEGEEKINAEETKKDYQNIIIEKEKDIQESENKIAEIKKNKQEVEGLLSNS